MTTNKKELLSKKYMRSVFFIILGSILWFFFGRELTLSESNDFLYINPVLNYETANMIMQNKNINLEEDLQIYLEKQKKKNETTHISVYFRNLNNGNWFGVNEKEEFSPASLMKLPLLMAYYKLSENQPKLLNEKVLYTPTEQDQQITQNIVPEKVLEPNKKYTIKDLLERMIIYSDNKASILLESILDFEFYQKAFTDIGINFPELKNGEFENNITIVEYTSFFRVLYNASYLTKSNSEYILDLLSKSTFTKGLKKWVPRQILVSHKFWERMIDWEKQLHDCWIVYYPKHPYLLCVMTRWWDWESLENIIAEISKKIYNEVDSQYK